MCVPFLRITKLQSKEMDFDVQIVPILTPIVLLND